MAMKCVQVHSMDKKSIFLRTGTFSFAINDSSYDSIECSYVRPMYLNRSEYDHGVNTFSPEGRIFQVEYALEAVKLGTTAVGIQVAEGVVLAAEKNITSKLIIPSSVEKICQIDEHIGAVMSGLAPDARTLIQHARVECSNYFFNYDELLHATSCAQSICDLALRFGESRKRGGAAMSRPFGVALLIAGTDRNENGELVPVLLATDPAGTCIKYKALAIGGGSDGAQSVLQEHYVPTMSLKEAKMLALATLKQVMEGKLTSENVEMADVKVSTNKFEMCKKEEIEQLVEELA